MLSTTRGFKQYRTNNWNPKSSLVFGFCKNLVKISLNVVKDIDITH
jgi:hypothetical protein